MSTLDKSYTSMTTFDAMKKKQRYAGRPRHSADPRLFKRGAMLTMDELSAVDVYAHENGISRSSVLHKGGLLALKLLKAGRKLKLPAQTDFAREAHAAGAFSATEVAQLDLWREKTGLSFSNLIRAGTIKVIS